MTVEKFALKWFGFQSCLPGVKA